MNVPLRAVTAVTTLALLSGGAIAAAPAASANTRSDCPSAHLCLYQQTSWDHDVYPRIITGSTASCFDSYVVNDGFFIVLSYVNKLSVPAYAWYLDISGHWFKEKTFPAGGSSSDISVNGNGYLPDPVICESGANPANYF